MFSSHVSSELPPCNQCCRGVFTMLVRHAAAAPARSSWPSAAALGKALRPTGALLLRPGATCRVVVPVALFYQAGSGGRSCSSGKQPQASQRQAVGGTASEAQLDWQQEVAARSGEALDIDLAGGGLVRIVGVPNATAVRMRATAAPRFFSRIESGAGRSCPVEMTRRGCAVLIRPTAAAADDRDASGPSDTSHGRTLSSHWRSAYERLSGLLRLSLLHVPVEVQVPLHFNARIVTKGSDVSVSGVCGNISLSTLGGDVTMSNVAGNIGGTTMGGDLQLRNTTGSLGLGIMGGDAEISHCQLDGALTSAGGDVKVAAVDGSLHVQSLGGDIELQDVGSAVSGRAVGGELTRRGLHSRQASRPAARCSSATAATAAVGAVALPSESPALESDSKVQMATMAGNITVGAAPAGADLRTMAGNIHVGAASGLICAHTMAGNIQIDAADGSVEAETMAGHVTVRLAHPKSSRSEPDCESERRRVDINCASGSVDLAVPADFSATFDIQISCTQSNDAEGRYRINSDFPLAQRVLSEGGRLGLLRSILGVFVRRPGSATTGIHGTGLIGDGRHRIVIRTVIGNVTLRRT